jgi:hypothetical protein
VQWRESTVPRGQPQAEERSARSVWSLAARDEHQEQLGQAPVVMRRSWRSGRWRVLSRRAEGSRCSIWCW